MPDGIGDVEPALPLLDEVGDHLGGVLEVAVHHHHGAASGVVQPGGHGGLVAEVPTQTHHADPRVERLQLTEDRGRSVAAPIVDKDDLERHPQAAQRRNQAIEQRFEVQSLVVDRDHDA